MDLLAEHCGLRAGGRPSVEKRKLASVEGLVEYLDGLAETRNGLLRRLTREAILKDQQWLKVLERWGFSFDPGKPLIEESLHETLPGPSLSGGVRWFREWLTNGS